jgi:hypothetical protein
VTEVPRQRNDAGVRSGDIALHTCVPAALDAQADFDIPHRNRGATP